MGTREKENMKLLQQLPEVKEGLSYEHADLQCKCWTVSILADISKSLSIIADKLPENPDERLLRELMKEPNEGKNENPEETRMKKELEQRRESRAWNHANHEFVDE